MFNIDKRTYIIRKANSEICRINFSSGTIVMSTLLRTQIWNEPTLLPVKFRGGVWAEELVVQRDVIPDYSVCTDYSGAIRLLCRDRDGRLIHMRLDGGYERQSTEIRVNDSTKKEKGPLIRHTEIFNTVKGIMFCCLTGNKEDCALAVCTPRGPMDGGIVEMRTLDGIVCGHRSFILTQDSTQCPYIFYNRRESAGSSSGYRKFIEESGMWSDFQPVYRNAPDREILSAAVDFQGGIYLIGQVEKNGCFDMICHIRHADSNNWVNVAITGGDGYPFFNSSVLAVEERILVYWIKEEGIYYRLSTDCGYTWEKIRIWSFPEISPLCCIAYKTSRRSEFENSCINLLPGIITGRFKLAFLNELYPAPTYMVLDEISELLSSMAKEYNFEMARLKGSIAEVNRNMAEFYVRLSALEEKIKAEEKHRPEAERKKPIKGADTVNSPLMPGGGFSEITEEYLRSVKKKPGPVP